MSHSAPADVLLIGFGAVGVIYAYILEKTGRARVTALARSNYGDVKENGIRIDSEKWGHHIYRPYRVEKSFADITDSTFKYVLITTKAVPEIATAVDLLKPLLETSKPKTFPTIVFMQNGLAVEKDLYEEYQRRGIKAPILTCAVYITTNIIEDGSIKHGSFERIVVGVYRETSASSIKSNSPDEQALLDDFASLFDDNTAVEVVANVAAAKYHKNMWNATIGTSSALTRLPFRDFVSTAKGEEVTVELLRSLMAEVLAVGRTIGYDATLIPDNAGDLIIDRTVQFGKEGLQHTPSITLDVLLRKPCEIEVILGEIISLGKQYGVQTPRLIVIHQLLKIVQLDILHGGKA